MQENFPQSFSYTQLDLIARVAEYLASTSGDVGGALAQVLEWLDLDCGMERGVITLMKEDGSEVQADIAGRTVPTSQHNKMRYRAGEGITGRVFATGEPAFLPRMDQGDFLDRSGLRKGMDLSQRCFLCCPISYHGSVIGTFSVDKDVAQVGNPDLELEFLGRIARLIAPFVQRRRLEDRWETFHREKQPGGELSKLIGKSEAINQVQKLVVKVADARTTVLLTGETGTGKGVVAQMIHNLSAAKGQPFVELNCGAIPENLVESELFGHEKGAFTGATQRRVGALERAGRGTVFLDEIGELPLNAQTRLLRVLQTREFERVGGSSTLNSAARVVAATNRDLETGIVEGSFRSDLYYRLNVFPIELPPVRERGKADIMLLVDHFVQRLAGELNKPVHRLDTPAIDMLTAYHWPGNVREMENVIERAILLADGDVIHGHHLPPSLQLNRYSEVHEDPGDFNTAVRNFEIELITEALKDTQGNQTKAAEALGITKRMIQYKVDKYNIDYRRFR
ncbi:MAG: sigma-54 interaction domain-containing protein [Verrucomicrobiota bacterium]